VGLLEASEVAKQYPGWKVVIPSDASYAGYYSQAISKTAPDPAAARLWEEYLYSATGQNLWLQGEARPIELPSMVKSGSVDEAAYKALPAAPSGPLTFPTEAQITSRSHGGAGLDQRDRWLSGWVRAPRSPLLRTVRSLPATPGPLPPGAGPGRLRGRRERRTWRSRVSPFVGLAPFALYTLVFLASRRWRSSTALSRSRVAASRSRI